MQTHPTTQAVATGPGVRQLLAAILAAGLLAACTGASPETPAAALLAVEPPEAPAGVSGDKDADAAAVENPDDGGQAAESAEPEAATAPPPVPVRPAAVLDSFRVEANYAVTSTLADGSQRVQHVVATGSWISTASPWGYDAAYRLANTADGSVETLEVVLAGENAAFAIDGKWNAVPRQADMPFGDPHALLDTPLLTRLQEGRRLGEETVAGVPAVHYRIDDPELFTALLGDALATGDGDVASVLLDGWLAADGYVVQYVLDAVYTGITTVDADGQAVQADQVFALRYALGDLNAAPPVAWPEGAPAPGTIEVPGFAAGEFPLPEGAVAVPALGTVEIVVDQPAGEVEEFYAARLVELGWSLAEEYGLYTATKEGQSFSFLVTADDATGGSKVEVFLVNE